MADDSQPQPQPDAPPPPPPPPPQAQPSTPAVVPASGGAVNLRDPFFRQLESDRGLPPGILSAMAEKESGGNALKVNPSAGSTASGLYQITAPSARAFGLSPDERFDPVKSATAVADMLARRADQYGIERAIGMHYGGPGTPFTQTVGTSGLSPAQYAGDVIRRSTKYGGSASDQTIGYPSGSFDDSPRAQYAQPQAQPQGQEQQFYRQYLQSTAPDGSTTIREIVSPNLLDHDAAIEAEKRAGYTFQNFVEPSKMAAVPPAQATPPQPAQSEAPLLPSAVVPTSGAAPSRYTPPADSSTAAPGSHPWLNLIPPVAATVGPLALAIAQPELGIPLWLASGGLAAIGGAGGEAAREKLAGEDLSPRNIATQGAVSGLTDVGMTTVVNPYVLGPAAKWATGRIGPMLGAAEDLAPTLTAEGTTVTAPRAMAPPPPAQVTMHTIDLAAAKSPEALTEGIQTLVKQATAEERPAIAAAWFATVRQRAADAGDPATYIKAAYDALGEDTQRALFGSGKGQLERLLGTAWKGGTTEDIANLTLRGGIPGAGGYAAHALGIPNIPGLATTRALGDLSAPFAARQFLVSPGAARFGAGLSSFGGVAGPAASGLAAQSVAERARQAGLPTF